ncbi:hypothetical protein QUC26_09385 [Pseudomonas asiatica]|uniref:hypothetical protein n=1 Tax=Pseudomonas asiatica TaxID=2219225 RepID=UPI0025A1D406|nr:hypothetical protein [Pseudomonas asiatica]WJM55340.1 hypothetical protein QUC26_09385 [Pseudomonas asiatica]
MAGKNPYQQQILDAWAKAQAEGMPMTKFVESVKDHPTLKVSVQGLRNWTKGEGAQGASPRAMSPRATSKTGGSLIAEFEAQYKNQKDHAFLLFLENAVKDLEAQLAAAQAQLRNHKESMGIIEPSVDE